MSPFQHLLSRATKFFHSPSLPNPMTAILSLLVIVWVEVNIMEDDCVGSSEIDSQAPSSCRQQKHKNVIIICKLINQLLPVGGWKRR